MLLFGLRPVGLQLKEVKISPGNSVKEAVWALVPSAAVTTAVCVVLTVPAVAVKLAVLAPVATVTDVGTVRLELLSLMVTAVLAGAA